MAAPSLTGTRTQQIQEVYNLIVSRITPTSGNSTAVQYANSWKAYADSHTSGTVGQLYIDWFLNESDLTSALGSSIGQGLTATGNITGAVPGDLSALSPESIAGGIWGTLTSGALWKRIAEGIVALILLDVGLKSMTGTSVIESAAKKTPAGRIAKVLK